VDAHLPLDLLATGLQALVSCDGQIYLGCGQCGREARIHYRWVADPARFPEAACAVCGGKLEKFTRHLHHDVYQCRDCQNQFESGNAGFGVLSCGVCGSKALQLLASEIVPPFPPTFDQIAPPKRQPWGVLLRDDLAQMRGELGLSRLSMDFASHLLLNVRFCERLRLANNYPPETIGVALLNEEGNLWLEHCKRTSSLETGLLALELFEQLGAQQRDGAHYIIAYVSDVLLLRFSETELAVGGRPALRSDAVLHGRAALRLAEQEAESDPNGLLTLAKIEVLLGRLLAAGDAGTDERLEAITVVERALSRNVFSPEEADDTRVRRALIIAELPDADAKLVDDAISVLERNVALLKEKGPAERLWRDLFNLGQLYYRRGNLEEAVHALRESADIARDLLVQAGSADILAEEGGKYLIVFETLASFLAEAGRGREALAAYETLRGAVPRLADNEAQRTATAVRSVMKVLEQMAKAENPDYQPTRHLTFLSPDIETELGKIRGRLLETGTVLLYYGWTGERATALLLHTAPDGQICVDPAQWQFLVFPTRAVEEAVVRTLTVGEGDPRRRVPGIFNGAIWGSPGPLRNRRLTIASREAFRLLFTPIEDRLRVVGAKRLAICANGLLSAVSFETISDPDRPGWFLADDFQVCYVPSLGIASNMASHGGTRGNSLLIIGYSGTDLPGVNVEIEAIRATWRGKCTVLRGSTLNKRAALDELAKDYDFIHFSGHGAYDYDEPLKSAFYFAAGGREAPGDAYRLTAEDLLRIRLAKHPVVTLSACSSLVYDATHRVTGLSGSLLQIGASAIIGSRWPVADDIALALMCDTYGAIAARSTPFAAFLHAQRSIRVAHEIEDWGAFSYLGLP
jgi:tetratricopeptide (TPR) repeat protein